MLMRWNVLIVLVIGLCVCVTTALQAEKKKHVVHHKLRRHKHNWHSRDHSRSLHPSFREQDDTCMQVKSDATTAFTTSDSACGHSPQTISPGTVVKLQGDGSAVNTPDCPTGSDELTDGCSGDPNPCTGWYQAQMADGTGSSFWIPVGYLDSSPVSCPTSADSGSAAASTGPSAATPTDTGSSTSTGGSGSGSSTETDPDLTIIARPVDYAVKQLTSSDNLCYWTPYYGSVSLRDTPCGTTIATVPANTKLTPLYDYINASQTCTEMSHSSVADQRRAFDAAEARRRAAAAAAGTTFKPNDFSYVLPFQYIWWTRVSYQPPTGDAQEGWVSTDKVIKKLCDPTTTVTCDFTPNEPKRCFRVTSRKNLKDAPCGSNVQDTSGSAVVGLQHDIFVTADGDPPTVPAGCSGSWKHVTLSGTDGFIDSSSAVREFGCNGDGWLTTVGGISVIKIDHSRDTNGASLTSAQNPAPNKFLLHTIEGAWPRYGDYPSNTLDTHKYWPNFHLARDRTGQLVIAQYFSVYSGSRALTTLNGIGIVQVEIGARSDNPFTEKDWVVAVAVRDLYHAVAAYTGMPICKDSRINFLDNHAYGPGPNRPSEAQFRDIHGIVGHQHAPADNHWDPGMIDPYKLL